MIVIKEGGWGYRIRTYEYHDQNVVPYRLANPQDFKKKNWLRESDLNQRPSGYEPDELPTALSRDINQRDLRTLLGDTRPSL